MKNLLFVILVFVLFGSHGFAQVSALGNAGIVTNYVGWNASQAFPLHIRHNANQPINFFTNNTQRMTLTGVGRLGVSHSAPARRLHVHGADNATGEGVLITNAATGSSDEDGLLLGPVEDINVGQLNWQEFSEFRIVQADDTRMRFNRYTYGGYNAVTPQTDVTRIILPLAGNAPAGGLSNTHGFSLLHMGTTSGPGGLSETNTLRRPWLNIGTTYTGGADIFYVGLLQSPTPSSTAAHVDAVLAWGCNEGDDPSNGPDNFRMLFYKPIDVTPITDANEDQGREVLRMTPGGNMGVGDFSHMPNGLNEQPTQRLDVNGTARFRAVPSNTPNVLLTGVGTTSGDYVVNNLAFNSDPNTFLAGNGTWAATQCDWNIVKHIGLIRTVVRSI